MIFLYHYMCEVEEYHPLHTNDIVIVVESLPVSAGIHSSAPQPENDKELLIINDVFICGDHAVLLFISHINRDCDQSPRWGGLYPSDVGSCTWTNRCCRVSAPKCMKKQTSCIIQISWIYYIRACPLYVYVGHHSVSFFTVGCWPQPPGQREGECIVFGLQ